MIISFKKYKTDEEYDYYFAVDSNNRQLELRANARAISVYDINTGEYLGRAEILHTEETVLVEWWEK